MEDLVLLAVTGIASLTVLVGGFMGLSWTKYRALDQHYVKEKVKYYSDLYNEAKDETKHWRGKWNQRKQDIQIEGDYDVTSPDDLASVAKLVLPEIMHLLPEGIQKHAKGFLANPDMIDMVAKLYEKHPEEIQRIVAGFIKKTGIKKTESKADESKDFNPSQEEISNFA